MRTKKDVPKSSKVEIKITDVFTADPAKTNYLRVVVGNIKTCKTQMNFSFATAETSPTTLASGFALTFPQY